MENPGEENLKPDPALVKTVEKIISQSLGRTISFSAMDLLTESDRRNAVFRCVAAVGSGLPGTYIVKKITPNALAAGNDAMWEKMRFYNDWIGAEFLSSFPSDAPISPRYYGGDAGEGFFVLEDLGEHKSLVGPLLEGDARGAEAALMRYATCLGKLHALTAGKAGEYMALYSSRLPGAEPFAFELHELEQRMEKVQSHLERLGVPIPTPLLAEIQEVENAVLTPGPFSVYIHSDPCPDNVFDLGDRMRLIDFETSHFGHALLDGVYSRMIWPTCWCANRIPAEVIVRIENRYRAELALGVPEAQEDALWETALVDLCGLAMLITLAIHLEVALDKDHEWGLATLRQRVLARLEAFIKTSEEFRRLPALRGTASRLLPLLQARWKDTPELPFYPAFQRPTARANV